MNTYLAGYDGGNGVAKLLLFDPAGQAQHLAIPSAVASGTLSDLQASRAASGQQERAGLGEEDYVLVHGGTSLYMGRLALVQAADPQESRGDINRYWSLGALRFLLTLSGALIFDREFRLVVVSGLPAETYSSANRKRVQTALEGTHPFTLNGQERLAHIEVAAVVQEGAGGTVLFGSRKPVKQATIDVGERTTDIWVARGQEAISTLCKGIDKGVGYAADLLAERVFAAYRRKLTTLECRAILQAHVTAGMTYPDIAVSGHTIPRAELWGWAEGALRQTGELICSFLRKVLRSTEQGDVGTDLDSALLVGGGAYYFQHDIRAVLPFAEVATDAEFVNALFYAKTARRLVERRSAQTQPVRAAL